MNIPLDRLQMIAKNPHTSIAAALYMASKFGSRIASAWWPQHKHEIEVTADSLEGAAVGWGLLMAGDASKSLTKDEAETGFVKKNDTNGTVNKP